MLVHSTLYLLREGENQVTSTKAVELNAKRGSVLTSAAHMQSIAARLGVQATVVGVSAAAVQSKAEESGNGGHGGGDEKEEVEFEVEEKCLRRFVCFFFLGFNPTHLLLDQFNCAKFSLLFIIN